MEWYGKEVADAAKIVISFNYINVKSKSWPINFRSVYFLYITVFQILFFKWNIKGQKIGPFLESILHLFVRPPYNILKGILYIVSTFIQLFPQTRCWLQSKERTNIPPAPDISDNYHRLLDVLLVGISIFFTVRLWCFVFKFVVVPECWTLSKCVPTNSTSEWAFSCVNTLMSHHILKPNHTQLLI